MKKQNLKIIDTVTDQIQQPESVEASILKMAKYCYHKHQKVAICIHKHDPCVYHTHEFFEINYVHRGNCINLVENENIMMNEGDLILIHPGAFHTLYADSQCLVYNFLINKEWLCEEIKSILPAEGAVYNFLENAGTDHYYKYMVCPFSAEKEVVLKAAVKLIEYAQNYSSWTLLRNEAAALEFLCLLGENCQNAYLSHGQGESSQKMINILMYMTENYATVTLEMISERFFYSKTHICRLFMSHLGKSFNQTLIEMKLSHACFYLKNTDITVDEIAHTVGYGSTEHFQRLFKKKNGMTPGEYRARMIAK